MNYLKIQNVKKKVKKFISPRNRKTDGNVEIKLLVNNEAREINVNPKDTLAEVLRNKLELKSVKIGCEMGECGSCTVLMEGEPVTSCLVLAISAEGKEILTLEGLANNEEIHPIQEAFIENQGFQCGWCTPGMILVVKSLLDKNPDPSHEEIKNAISGNLCRCGAYPKIIESAKKAAGKMKEKNE